MAEKTCVTLQDVKEAAERIKPYIVRTPLLKGSDGLDEALGCKTYLKCENLQKTGAFKLRGACSKFFSLTQEEKDAGIITSSSGNHGKACAYLGKLIGCKSVVVLPDDSPMAKQNGIRALGAEVILADRLYDKRWAHVREQVAEHGYTIIHAYEDYTVMAGQGTIALEILEDLPDVDTIIVPVGGGGLISGVATAAKAINPNIKIVGVQPKAADAYVKSRKAGEPVETECYPTIADGITARRPGTNPWPIIQELVDEMVSVSEEALHEAIRLVTWEAKLYAEPSSVSGVAAVLSKEYVPAPDEKVAFIVTSGNWDLDLYGKILEGETVPGLT